MALIWQTISCDILPPDRPSPGLQVVPYIGRTKVPGGWLVFYTRGLGGLGDSGLTFYPDPEHKWDGNSLP